jgi:probable phosphoglycerate mutase
MKTTIFLIRHGESTYNREDRVQGDSDFSVLTDHGARQAEQLKEALEAGVTENGGFDSIYSSPLKRAMETAHIIRPKGLDIMTDVRLKERGFGTLQGMFSSEFEEKYPEIWKAYNSVKSLDGVKGAESSEDFQERAWDALQDIIEENKGKKVLVVTHGGIIKVIIAKIMGVPLEERGKLRTSNVGITVIKYDHLAKKYKTIKMNDTNHLHMDV